MLRPATPLTILLFAAFVLLLISVLSTPIIKAIPLATFGGVDFGVFGYCKGSTCSAIEIGYDTSNLFTSTQDASFDLPTSTRTTLSAILIVHPIAAFFTLVMLLLAFSAHFHSPSHSPRYLLGMFILSILTLLVALLAFLIDVLLFVPHMAWGSYVVLAATVLIAASGIVACAMRRTLVSRKARKRRIAENAEMNGENFYNRQNNVPAVPPVAQTSAPMVSGAAGGDKVATFAAFDMNKPGNSERTSDERQPLTAMTPSERSPDTMPGDQQGGIGMADRYGGPPQMGQGLPRGGMQNGYGNPRDQYGNPAPGPGYGPNRSRDPSQNPSLRNQYSNGSLNNQRGRGGYGPPGRGGFAPRGRGYGPPMNGRGGYGPPGRGGYGPPSSYRGGMMGPAAAGVAGAAGGMMGRGARGPPPGYSNGYGGPQGGRGGYNGGPPPQGSYDQYGRQPSDGQSQDGYAVAQGGYGRRPSEGEGSAPSYRQPSPNPPATYRKPSPQGPGNFIAYPGGSQGAQSVTNSLPRAESPPPMPGIDDHPIGHAVGQAVEMDATTGSPQHAPKGFGDFGDLRESNSDIAGMVSMQQGGIQPGQLLPVSRPEVLARHATVMSDTSHYSSEEPYVPPRAAWGDNPPPGPGIVGRSSPLNPTTKSPPPQSTPSPAHQRNNSSDNYYEDVDPRFAESSSPMHHIPSTSSALPAALTVGARDRHNYPPQPINTSLPGDTSFEDLHAGARSPAESEHSTFTSVSQRGINPRWHPALGPAGFPANPPNGSNGGFNGGGPQMMRRPVPPPQAQRENLLLQSNPDFELPIARGRGGPRGGRGMGPYPRGM